VSAAVLKLGGSVITDKSADQPLLRRDRLDALAAELASLPSEKRPRALVHGAGSFGHLIVSRTRIHERVKTQADRMAWAETQILQNELNVSVCRALLAVGIPAIPHQASAGVTLRDKVIEGFFSEAVTALVAEGLVPVLYGVPAVDLSGGCSILSGDLLAPRLAGELGCDLVVYGTDVDGVFDADPRQSPGAKQVARINRENWEAVRTGLGGSASVDVTGGMAAKVAELVAWAKRGIAARIVDATRPGRVAAALRGESVGTLIEW